MHRLVLVLAASCTGAARPVEPAATAAAPIATPIEPAAAPDAAPLAAAPIAPIATIAIMPHTASGDHVAVAPPGAARASEPGGDAAAIRQTIRAHLSALLGCYGSASGPSLLAFTIGVRGKVTAVTATGLPPDAAACVERVVRGLAFPAPTGGPIEVSYPFNIDVAG